MSLNNIIKTLETETQKEIEAIEQSTQESLAKLAKEYEQKLTNSKDEILTQANSEAQRTADLHLFAEQTELKKQVLQKKRSLIDNIYQQAIGKLSKLPDSEYQKMIVTLLKQLPVQSGSIIPAQGREKVTREAVKKSKGQFQVSSETVDSAGGFIWYSEKMNIDNTFEQLVRNAREETEIEIAQELFKNK